MKKIALFILSSVLLLISPFKLIATELSDFKFLGYNRPFYTKEEFYSLYKENLYRKVDNFNANIFWLEHSKKAPFGLPVKALAKIETKDHWLQYQRIFIFHINFLIMQNYLRLGEQFEKPNILFFNSTFKKEIKEGLEIAKIYYNRAKIALEDSMKMATQAWEFREKTPMSVYGETDKWIDTIYRLLYSSQIYHEYNYSKEIDKRLNEVESKLVKVEELKEE